MSKFIGYHKLELSATDCKQGIENLYFMLVDMDTQQAAKFERPRESYAPSHLVVIYKDSLEESRDITIKVPEKFKDKFKYTLVSSVKDKELYNDFKWLLDENKVKGSF